MYFCSSLAIIKSSSPHMQSPDSDATIPLDYRQSNRSNVVVSSPVSNFSFTSNEEAVDQTNEIRLDSVLSSQSYSNSLQPEEGNITQVSVMYAPMLQESLKFPKSIAAEHYRNRDRLRFFQLRRRTGRRRTSPKDELQQKWMKELSRNAELETLSILYAKSILDPMLSSGLGTRVTIGYKPESEPKKTSITSSSNSPPAKPRRSVTRTHKTTKEGSCPGSPSLNFNNRNVVIRAPRILKDELPKQSLPTARFAKSLPNAEALRSSCSHFQGLSTDSSVNDYSQLPFCDDPCILLGTVNINNRPPTFRHSIRVNEDGISDELVWGMKFEGGITELEQKNNNKNNTPICNGTFPKRKHNSSPKSTTDSASDSLDSGQCSGSAETSPGTASISRQLKENSSLFQVYNSNYDKCLPGYVRMASTMDHILRTGSAMYSLLTAGLHNPKVSKELFHKTNFYIQTVRQSACAKFMPNSDIELVLCAMRDAEREANLSEKSLLLSDYFAIVVRKMLEQSMIVLLLLIALEHLVHLLLFGDELCLEAIKSNAVENIVGFCQMSSTPSATLQLLLRNLAVLCGTSKGCLQLLSIGGFDIVIHVLCESTFDCSVEALMNNCLSACLLRLLSLIDECNTSESLLLCAAALANLSLQNAVLATDLLYQYNAILRLIQAFRRPNCDNIFVQEQIVTIFSRLASQNYEQALIAQGAIPVLLQMLIIADKKAVDYCKRIRYKAAVCLGTISSSGVGLKALFDHRGYNELCEVLRAENQKASPLLLICSSIKQRLETTYQVETVV
uniref:Protein inscuteable homologue C-terminal domain-containing protein n=1 Tax=Ditylenchus dipsaci TaxID=166011 RepID=A0A915DFJ9_9BILA